MTPTDPIHDLIRTALADLQPRISITRENIDNLTEQLAAENATHAALLEQDAAYRAALPADNSNADTDNSNADTDNSNADADTD